MKKKSTTMTLLVRMLTNLLRDKSIPKIKVPIIPDEVKEHLNGRFSKIGIYAHEGQKYEPVDVE